MNQLNDAEPIVVSAPPSADFHILDLPPMDLGHILAKTPKQDVLTAAQIASFAAPTGQRNLRNAVFADTHAVLGMSNTEAVRPVRIELNLAALKLSKALSDSKALPTAAEQDTLAAYTGWGGLAAPLCSPVLTNQLKSFVSDSEMSQLQSGILNAHYTPPEVVKFVFDCVKKLGQKPMRILDPCTGIGGFFGHMPKEIAENAELVGCEIDENSARIAKLLLPDAAIENVPFEKMKLPDGYFDLAIGNVPFGDYSVFDPETPNTRHLVHNAFFAKAMRKVTTGGLIAFITSAGTMDSETQSTRLLLASQCNLVAAFRLSTATFKRIANTEVVSDVLIFQKRSHSASANVLAWMDTQTTEQYGKPLKRNVWWENKPRAVLGYPTAISTKFAPRFGCTDSDYCAAMPGALDTLLPLTFDGASRSEVTNWADWLQTRHLGEKTEGSFIYENDKLMCIGNGKLVDHDLSETQASRVIGMLQISSSLRDLLTLQVTTTDDTSLKSAWGKANMLYDLFVRKHGPINAKVNRRLFFRDPGWPLLAASELYDDDTSVATKSDIYLKRTVNPVLVPQKTDSAEIALASSLAYCLKVDAEFMGKLMNKPADEVIAMLASTERIFWCPENHEWQLREMYLSGTLHQKIEAASSASTADPRMSRNIEALHAAFPERVNIPDIEFQMGSTFIGVDLVRAFLLHILEIDAASNQGGLVEVKYFAGRGKWTVKGPRLTATAAHARFGTARAPVLDLVGKALNGSTITVYDREEVDGVVRSIVNETETGLAREKLFEIKHEFDKWIRSDQNRSALVEETFNRDFNSYKAPTYDGDHLIVPGLNASIVLRVHQKNGIWRGIVGGDTLIAHGVGAGKTLVGIVVAQMKKRMGLCRTTALAVPNHLLMQFSNEYMRAFPLAKLLLIGSKDMGANAAVTLAKIATGNYDAVICTHSVFSSIPVGVVEIQQHREQVEAQLNADAGMADDANDMKAIQRQKKAAGELLDRYEHRQKKDVLTWGELGIDSLIIDESQAFKNLHFSTSLTNIAGLNMSFSFRAFDCYMKTRQLQVANKERGGVLFMTATPITNSVAEMFHLMRFLMTPKLKELGIERFDQWRANFGKTVSAIEQLPEGGGFRLQTRFASFNNVPNLMELFWSFADVVMREDLDLPVPTLFGGKAEVVELDRTENQVAYMHELVARAQAIRGPKENRPKPSEDNMLLVTSDGKKAALDMRLIDRSFADEPTSKLNVVVRNVYDIWLSTADGRLTQMVFCDMGTPGGSTFCVYDDMRDKLIAMGVPAGEIAFAHDANTDLRKEALWARVRKGIVRIIFGSTAKMGTGVNAQDLLYVKHDVDAPWRPDEIEQRDGRILRQGNQNEVVRILRYVTRQTFDAYNWQLLETKLRFILQVMSGKSRVRTIEEIDSRAMSFAEVKALATGNPKLIERAKLQQQESELMLKRKSFQNTIAAAAKSQRMSTTLVPFMQKQMEDVQTDVQTLHNCPEDVLLINDQKYEGESLKTLGGSALAAALERAFVFRKSTRYIDLGSFRTIPLRVVFHGDANWTTLFLELDGARDWRCELGESALGNVTRLINLAKRIESAGVAEAQSKLQREIANIASCQVLLEQPFAHARELADVSAARRQLEIDLGIAEDDNSGMAESDEDLAMSE